MAGTTAIPLTTLQTGAHTFGPASVADTDATTVLTVDRTVAGGLNSLTAAAAIEILIEQSDDGGTTWFLLVDGVIAGGPVAAKGGGSAATAQVGVTYGPGTGRQTRATLTVSGGPIRVQGSLTTS